MRRVLGAFLVPTLIALVLTGIFAYFGMGAYDELKSDRECQARSESLGRPVCPEWADGQVVGGRAW